MLINALRFKDENGPWTAFRVSSGTGRFRNYLCLVGPDETLRRALAAITLALTGRVSTLVTEAELTLSDDAGHAWTIRRRPGETRIQKDGQDLPAATAERQLLAALLDADLSAPGSKRDAEFATEIQTHRIIMDDDGLRVAAAAERGAGPVDTLRVVAERQIREIVHGCAQTLERPELENPALLARMARVLEPLYSSYRELCAQYRDVKDKTPDAADGPSVIAADPQADAAALRAELVLIREIAQAAEALLKPGASLKAWRDELGATEAQLAELASAHNLGDAAAARCPDDLRKPIDALAKLEAHTRLIRAAQAARKQCEADVEPVLRQYWDLLGTHLERDGQIAADLENCLHSLSARLAAARARAASPQHMNFRDDAEQPGLKTWFDRFRSRQQQELEDSDGGVAELEAAKATLELALGKLHELAGGLETARPRFSGTLKRFDDAHEDLVRNYGRHKEEWLAVAKESGLPEAMTLDGLLKLVTSHARLYALTQKRADLTEKIRDAGARLAKLGRLLPEWRRAAGSAKTADLSSPQLLLQEARDVIRYQEAKERRLIQLGEKVAEHATISNLTTVLKARRKAMLGQWRDAFDGTGVAAIDINHEGLPEVFRRASIVRALGLVVGSTGKVVEQFPFAAASVAAGRSCAASAYLITEAKTTNPARLALLSALEEAQGTELRVLLVADDGLAAMLGTLGIGVAQRGVVQRDEVSAPPVLAGRPADRGPVIAQHRGPAPRPQPAKAPEVPPKRETSPPAPGPVAQTITASGRALPAPGPVAQTITASGRAVPAPILSDKAREALGLLTGKRNT